MRFPPSHVRAKDRRARVRPGERSVSFVLIPAREVGSRNVNRSPVRASLSTSIVPAVEPHDVLDDGQAEPRAAQLARARAGPPRRTARRSAAGAPPGCRCPCRRPRRAPRPSPVRGAAPQRPRPCSVYFSALSSRFTSSCSSRYGSAVSGGRSAGRTGRQGQRPAPPPARREQLGHLVARGAAQVHRFRARPRARAPRAGRAGAGPRRWRSCAPALRRMVSTHGRVSPSASPFQHLEDPSMAVSGVRSSWEALATKSRFMASSRRMLGRIAAGPR